MPYVIPFYCVFLLDVLNMKELIHAKDNCLISCTISHQQKNTTQNKNVRLRWAFWLDSAAAALTAFPCTDRYRTENRQKAICVCLWLRATQMDWLEFKSWPIILNAKCAESVYCGGSRGGALRQIHTHTRSNQMISTTNSSSSSSKNRRKQREQKNETNLIILFSCIYRKCAR